jgi:hypothetical protein
LKYGVMLRGENFEIISETGVENLGFVTTRFVKAKTPEEAELIAVNMIRTDKNLLKILSKESKLEPKIYLEEMWLARWWKRLGGGGYTFYSMESEK